MMPDMQARDEQAARLPPPSEVPAMGVRAWPAEAIHAVLTVLNTELLRLLDAVPTGGHGDAVDGTCRVCGPILAALEEHQQQRQAVVDYLVTRARVAHWTQHGCLSDAASRRLAEAETAVRGLVPHRRADLWGWHPGSGSPDERFAEHGA